MYMSQPVGQPFLFLKSLDSAAAETRNTKPIIDEKYKQNGWPANRPITYLAPPIHLRLPSVIKVTLKRSSYTVEKYHFLKYIILGIDYWMHFPYHGWVVKFSNISDLILELFVSCCVTQRFSYLFVLGRNNKMDIYRPGMTHIGWPSTNQSGPK